MGSDYLSQVSYYDRLFDQALTGQYSLSIRLDPDGLSFSVYSHLVSRFIGLESVTFQKSAPFSSTESAKAVFNDQLSRFIEQHAWIQNNFRHTCIFVNSLNYTLIPHVLYNQSRKDLYLGYVHRHVESNIVLEHFLNSAEAWIVYSLNKGIFETLDRFFKSARLMHHAGSMIETILPRFRHSELRNPVFVNVRTGSFDIFVLKEGKLRYSNSFTWKANEDLIYYLVFVLDQLELNPENVPVVLLGNISTDSALFGMLERYIRHVDIIKSTEALKPGISIPYSDEYKFYDLLNPGLCG